MKQYLLDWIGNNKNRLSEKCIKHNFYKDWELISKLPGDKWGEKLYQYIYEITLPKCPVCDQPAVFKGFTKGYGKYCSLRCSQSDKAKAERIKMTIRNKYGVDNISQLDSVKKKKIDTAKEHYGTEYPWQSQSIKEKIKQTCKEKYGVENVAQSQSIKEKIKQTQTKLYDGFGMSSKLREHIIKTNIERGGFGLARRESKLKAKNTCMERYGYDCPLSSPEIQEKIKETNNKKYGVNRPAQLHAISSHPELLRIDTGGVWICKCPHPDCNKCADKTYITNSQVHNDRKNRSHSELCTNLLPISSNISTYEIHIRNILDELGVEHIDNSFRIIAPKSLDIYIPSHRIAIEINGSYHHSLACKDPYYHTNKYMACKEKGIKLVTIWTDWWDDQEELCKDLILYHLGLKDIETWKFANLGNLNLVDLNLYPSDNIEPHRCMHDGFECVDAGMFVL